MSATHSVPSIQDTQLGLTQGELQILRQQQQVMAQRSHQDNRPSDRGRGTSRHSQPSSRAASAASSQAGNRILLDPQHLRALQTHLDNVIRAIEHRIGELEDATEASVSTNSDRHRRTEAQAEREIERMRSLLSQIDRLEEDSRKVTRIKEVVKRLKQRVEDIEDKVDRTASSRHSDSRHGDRHGDSRHGEKHSSSRHVDLVYRPRTDRHR